MALMAFSDSKLNQTEFKAATYKKGLATVEEQLVTYRKNEVLFSEEVAVLKRKVACKDYEINVLKSKFEKVKQEKEGIEFKIAKFDNASKSLDKMLDSQITDKSKKGLGYNDVPPPHPLIYNAPAKLDLSYSGLDEFKGSEFKSYGSKDKQVSKDTSSFVESPLNVDKETVFLVDKKIEFVKPKNHEKPVKKSVRERMVSRNNYNRVDYDYYAKTTHPSAHRNMTPRAVLLKTGLTPLNTVRPVNTAHPKPAVHSAKSMSHFSKQAQSTDQRPFYKKTALTSRYVNTAIRHYHTERPRVDFKEFDEGYVTFRGGAHGGRISGKGTLKTDSLDFEDVYFVNELNFNLFSVSQMCDKKNYVLFTDTKCLVLSPNFKLPDESQITLNNTRKVKMFSFDMKNIVPKESLTCLFAKATLDESMLWHTRIGHINYKNINKLVKGKQHRASCKSKVLNPITEPLFMLHMDLFGPTFVSSLMHRKEKGIKREYSVDRTPQQNGVAERRNMTLIEAARTMLADSKLPTTFWAKAVSTAYYVQNNVLVVKPHNKKPYELFRGFKPALSFMKPFGCHVSIINTLDNLGNFDSKSDDGFFVGYSLSSKAFRVYNTRTRRVEENLHIGFLENKPMIEGNGPKWLFDIDSLTQSMNYVPVAAGTIINESEDASYFDSLSKDVDDGEPKYAADDLKQVEYGLDNENDAKHKSDDDSNPKEVNTAGQHVNIASPDVNTSSFNLNTVGP
ncbi:putative ribonuclease H-like domain-containing protein [Tanacetum coccineum]